MFFITEGIFQHSANPGDQSPSFTQGSALDSLLKSPAPSRLCFFWPKLQKFSEIEPPFTSPNNYKHITLAL
jgi:hypothetical protein